MINITPSIDGRKVVATGSIVVSPGRELSFQVSTILCRIVFNTTEDELRNVKVEQVGDNELLLTVDNLPTEPIAFDMGGIVLNNEAHVFALEMSAIGVLRPHRLIHYTLYQGVPTASPT